MANRSRISSAIESIKRFLSKKQPHIYSNHNLHQIFKAGKKKWNLPIAMTYKKFVEALQNEGLIGWCHLDFITESHEGYYLRSSTEEYVVSNLVHNCYISHATALMTWGMLEEDQAKIHINKEQSKPPPKYVKRILVQTSIDAAFKNEQRQSGLVTSFGNKEVVLIKGKFSDRLGVTELHLKGKEQIWITDLERTLIDCVVRPAYGPDPVELVKAFKQAKQLISINTLLDYLEQLNYIYPYHQSIGFYLEKAGNYTEAEINLFLAKGIEYDFYLTYKSTSLAYSNKWRLYFPINLE